KAAEAFSRALWLNREDAASHNGVGVCLLYQGQTDRAVESFRQAVKLQPDRVRYHCDLAAALHELGRENEAAGAHRRPLGLAPRGPAGALQAARDKSAPARVPPGDAREAVLLARMVCQAGGNDRSRALATLAAAQAAAGQFKEAAAAAEQAL